MFFRLVSIFSLLLFTAATAQAQSSENFYEDILVDEEIQVEDKADDAVRDARRLLQEKPKPITIERPEFKRRKKPQPVKKAEKTAAPEDLSAAPFGLLWGATVADIKNLGITLTPIEIKDYLNSYAATTLPKPIKTFREVDVTFGADNELWRIIAYGELLDDTPDAAKVMRLYKDYSQLLAQKYGNAKEMFTPAVKMVEKKIEKQGRKETVTVPEDQPIGNPEFLSQLQSGDAVLFATFENGDVGAALAVNVDGDNRSYIVIDYKNLKILKERQQKTLDAL